MEEKKKRVIKPLPNNYTKILLTAIPFLNQSRNDLEPERSLLKTMIPSLQQFMTLPMMDKFLWGLLKPWAENDETMESLWLTQRNCCWMIGGFYERTAPFNVLFPWIEDSLKVLKWNPRIENKNFIIGPEIVGDRNTIDLQKEMEFEEPLLWKDESFKEVWLPGFRGRLVKLIYDAFWGSKNAEFYITFCARCGEIAEKRNNRQEWCSDYCRTNPDAKPRNNEKISFLQI